MNEIVNNKVNLCDSCSQVYPDCTSKPEDVYFGDGIGHDNICACSEYQPSTQPQSTMGQVDEAVQSTKDCISRQDAIDVADAVWSVTGDKNVAKVWDQIKDLPSAQPQRMRGKWIDITKTGGDELWKCSECGELELEDSYYCPNCGADMRGEQDET